MTPLRKILSPTDFSETAKRANRQAVDMAERDGAELILLNVLEESDLSSSQVLRHRSFPNFADEVRKGVERELLEMRQELARDGVTIKTLVRTGSPAVEIADCAEAEQADVIVIGTHGYGAIRRFLLGSTAERLLRIAPCSVFLVRPGGESSGREA